ncbi:nucleotide exchange factor GrpE [Corynebacterium jeikeium]|uniref:nucleotide exchange factor GrpE n=1 Tax=Corynebacterium jeikeium TaxID=38289 RepID=UPI0001B71786|nr:nucleotide exchange factor GrpE [Corynebacterium jeikeium]EEW16597.1 co-chaperone GrpE [Corynebacterium jeikeium ATCC 43734]OOD29841.1 nucleotide exchange factor GrpE [Corynebacterium jeikeium]WCZ52734.1 heat shock protein GrpE [Corynebacterium jeikeium]SUY81959.1 heat shock protein GrpE [Corynebacterium jeikeium]
MAEDLNQDPGAPENTDPEATSAESAEAAAAEAAEAQGVDEGLADGEAAVADAEGVNPEDSNSIEAELAERTEDLQRVTAEYTNYRRRVERDRASVITGAKAEVAAELLPILDDLEMAEQHGDLTGPLKSMSDKLQSVMASMKVEKFGEEGDEFDPNCHEAVQDTSSGDDKVLATILRRGYRLGDRVLRNAMVIIGDPQ